MGDCLNHRLHGLRRLHGLKLRDWIGRDVGRVFVGNDRAREQDLYGICIGRERAREQNLYQDLLSPSLITQLITHYSFA